MSNCEEAYAYYNEKKERAWRDRLIKEYTELKDKTITLRRLIEDYYLNQAPAFVVEDIELLKIQCCSMEAYMYSLEARAKKHGIELPEDIALPK